MNTKQLKKLRRLFDNLSQREYLEINKGNKRIDFIDGPTKKTFNVLVATRVCVGDKGKYIACKNLWDDYSHNEKKQYWKNIKGMLTELRELHE